MIVALYFIVALGVAGGFAFLCSNHIAKTFGAIAASLGSLESALQQRETQIARVNELYEEMVDLGSLQKLIAEIRTYEESLKAERGRITITQAELETVEGRLRELEEIERELGASGLETQEELNILEKKQSDLRSKNEALKSRIAESLSQIEQIMQELEMSTQMVEQVMAMKTELLQTEEKISTLLIEIEQGNEQYFILKRRYDALDIEYAQLYEKFAEAEEQRSQS